MLDRKVYIIGGGNMGFSIADGLLNDDINNSVLLNIVDCNKKLKKKYIKKKIEIYHKNS